MLTLHPPIEAKLILGSISIGLTSARTRSLALALSTMLPWPSLPALAGSELLAPKVFIGCMDLSSLSCA